MTAKLTSPLWGIAKDSCFHKALPPRRGPAMLLPQQAALQPASLQATTPKVVQLSRPHSLREIRKILDSLSLPHHSLQALNLNLHLLVQHISTHVAVRTALFLENWARFTKDPWVLTTVKGYQILLENWPEKHWSSTTFIKEQQIILLEEVTKLREKGAIRPVLQEEAHIVSPVFVVPKSGGDWRLIIDLRHLNTCMLPPHFKMEGLFMLPSIISQGWPMVKLDLKDAYLTIPMAQESQNLLTFKVGHTHKLMQFQCLPIGLCTALFAFSKVTKPVTQFLRQLGIHLIIYLDDLLLAAPSRERLLVDLSTVLWTFSSLRYLINIPKSITAPTCHLEFLGYLRGHIDIPSHAQDQQHQEGGNPPSATGKHTTEGSSMRHWNIGSNQGSGVDWATTLPCPARSEDTVTSAAFDSSNIDKPNTGIMYRSSLVAFKYAPQLLDLDCETRDLYSDGDRCFHVWLGSCLPGSYNWWQMDIRGVHINWLELKSNFSGFAVFFEGQDQGRGLGQIRQSHSYSLPEQDGQSHKIPTVSVSSGDLGLVPATSDQSSCRILRREGQCCGRLGIQSPRQQRLAAPAISL